MDVLTKENVATYIRNESNKNHIKNMSTDELIEDSRYMILCDAMLDLVYTGKHINQPICNISALKTEFQNSDKDVQEFMSQKSRQFLSDDLTEYFDENNIMREWINYNIDELKNNLN